MTRVSLLLGLLLAGGPSARAGSAPVAVEQPLDREYRAALDLVYDGSFLAAEQRLAALAEANPDDPVACYLQALALEWRLEQTPEDRGHDASVLAFAARSLALADARLAKDPRDGRALLARGAAHGAAARLHLFRWQRSQASRESVRMREALLAARGAGLSVLDLDFGLGLYDYYADTLPRFFKIVAFFLRIPGGDRERGRAAIARVARGGSLFHDDEARAQMYDIHTYFERRPDRALFWIRELRRRYPGCPLWGLRLAELLRDPLGLFPESAAVCRQIVDSADRHRHPNYQPVVGEIGRVLLAEALLGELRTGEARANALRALASGSTPPRLRAHAQLVVARSLELEAEPAAARARYAAVEAEADPPSTRRAQAALRSPAAAAEIAATPLLARSRRARERGDLEQAQRLCLQAFEIDPEGDEQRLCAAREKLRQQQSAAARALAHAVVDSGAPWLRPQARLVLAAALERDGARQDAIAELRLVFEQPFARPALREQARAELARLAPELALPERPPYER